MENFINAIKNFFRNFFDETSEEEEIKEVDEEKICKEEKKLEISLEECSEERVNFSRRTVLTRLYVLEQKIIMFKENFPDEYEKYLERIKNLRANYNKALDENKKELTFQINPEFNGSMLGNTIRLERDVDFFIEKTVKFETISRRLKELIVKLGILYNVTIRHSKETDKNKAYLQLERAENKAESLYEEISQCDLILEDEQMRESFAKLLSYAEYLITKTRVRVSLEAPNEKAKIMKNFNYTEVFKTFAREELQQYEEIISKIPEEEIRKTVKRKKENLVQEIAFNQGFLDKRDDLEKIFELEDTIFNILKLSDGGDVKFSLLKSMDIRMEEKSILQSPIVQSKVALTQVFAKTHSENILITLKFLAGLSDEIRYKDIYFILIIFDVLDIALKIPTSLQKEMEKYSKKYPYSKDEVEQKKKKVFQATEKQYLYAFNVEDNDEKKEVQAALKDLNLDFEIVKQEVLLNSFYFKSFERVLNNMKSNTKNPS